MLHKKERYWHSLSGPFVKVFAGAVLISFSAVFVKVTNVSPAASAFYRVLFGGIGLSLLAVVRKERLHTSKRLWGIVFAAALFFAADLNCWHASTLYIGPGLSTILVNFQVFFLALAGAVFFRERLSRKFLIALPLAVTGLWLLLGENAGYSSENLLPGVGLGLAAAVLYAGYILILRNSRSVPERFPLVANMACVSMASALVCYIMTVLQGDSLAIPAVSDAVWLVLYGLLCQGFGWLFLSSALPQLPAAVAGLLMLVQPALSFLWDILFFGRSAGMLVLAGAVMAITAIWLGISGQQQTK